jgi:hypothetical protein
MIPLPDASNWYWFVAGSTTQVYSSAAVSYVPVTDGTYQAWVSAGGVTSRISTEQELFDILLANGVPVPAAVKPSDTLKEGMFANVPQVVRVWALDVDNRVRVLEGQPTRNANQFKNYVKSLI